MLRPEQHAAHPANATHSIRGSKTSRRRRAAAASQRHGLVLSESRRFSFVSFSLRQRQRGIRTHFLNKVKHKCTLPCVTLFSRRGKRHIPLSQLFSLLLYNMSQTSPLPSLLSVSVLSPLCTAVICSEGLGRGYSDGWYGVWPRFSTQLLTAALRWESDGRVWDDGRLLSLDSLTLPLPAVRLTVGVRRHADPSGRHLFLGHPEWPHPWKALQGDRGTVTRPQQRSCKKQKKKKDGALQVENFKINFYLF